MAAQVMSVFVEVESDGISSRFSDLLPVVEGLLKPDIYLTAVSYYGVVFSLIWYVAPIDRVALCV